MVAQKNSSHCLLVFAVFFDRALTTYSYLQFFMKKAKDFSRLVILLFLEKIRMLPKKFQEIKVKWVGVRIQIYIVTD